MIRSNSILLLLSFCFLVPAALTAETHAEAIPAEFEILDLRLDHDEFQVFQGVEIDLELLEATDSTLLLLARPIEGPEDLLLSEIQLDQLEQGLNTLITEPDTTKLPSGEFFLVCQHSEYPDVEFTCIEALIHVERSAPIEELHHACDCHCHEPDFIDLDGDCRLDADELVTTTVVYVGAAVVATAISEGCAISNSGSGVPGVWMVFALLLLCLLVLRQRSLANDILP